MSHGKRGTGCRQESGTGRRIPAGFLKPACILIPACLVFGCAYTPAQKYVGTPALDGKWVLADVRCQSGPLGELGARIAEPVHTRVLDESYEVDSGVFTWRVRERTPGADQSQYCETVMTGTWTADGKTLQSSGATFKSRGGVNGYKCYEPFTKPKAEASHEYKYELGHGRLQIHHKNPKAAVKDEKGKLRVLSGCDDGSDLLYVFERE